MVTDIRIRKFEKNFIHAGFSQKSLASQWGVSLEANKSTFINITFLLSLPALGERAIPFLAQERDREIS